MMASMLGFEMLPALNEGDERICLADILMLRDACLSDKELWAVCMETCVGIQDVNSSEMFQTLCITPESLAFDASGAACFLDLATDPETMYIPPEYESVGNSYKAHLYSLGMTMLFAAEYNAGDSEADQVGMGEELSALVTQMTEEEYDKRASLSEVMRLCEKHLDGKSSQRLCKELAAIAKLDDESPSSDDSSSSSSSYDEVSPVPRSKVLGDHQITDAKLADNVIDLQHDLPRATNNLPPSPLHHIPVAISASTSGSSVTMATSSASSAAYSGPAHKPNETVAPPSGASTAARAISPPAAFRNSAEDYKSALVESALGAPVPSPPKVSRMMALLDNGEVGPLNNATASATGGEGIDVDGNTGTTPTSPLTPLTLGSPVPTCELGASQNSAFQVVWSPRSSKTTSPVPANPALSVGGTEGKDAQNPAASSLQVLSDTKNVNYSNLLSVAMNNGSEQNNENPSALDIGNKPLVSARANAKLNNNDPSSSNHSKMATDSNRADTDLKSVRNKLDELMAKYGQKLSPRLDLIVNRSSNAIGIANRSEQVLPLVVKPHQAMLSSIDKSNQHQDLPQLIKKSASGLDEDMTEKQHSLTDSSGVQYTLTAVRNRRDELDFEFGDCISPVPTSVRRTNSGRIAPTKSSTGPVRNHHLQSGESDDLETDSLEEELEEESESSEECQQRAGTKLKVSVVKIKPGSDEDDNDIPVPPKVQLFKEASMLDDLAEEDEEEEQDTEMSDLKPLRVELEEEEDSNSFAGSNITNDSDVTECSDIEHDDDRSSCSSSEHLDSESEDPSICHTTQDMSVVSGLEVTEGNSGETAMMTSGQVPPPAPPPNVLYHAHNVHSHTPQVAVEVGVVVEGSHACSPDPPIPNTATALQPLQTTNIEEEVVNSSIQGLVQLPTPPESDISSTAAVHGHDTCSSSTSITDTITKNNTDNLVHPLTPPSTWSSSTEGATSTTFGGQTTTSDNPPSHLGNTTLDDIETEEEDEGQWEGLQQEGVQADLGGGAVLAGKSGQQVGSSDLLKQQPQSEGGLLYKGDSKHGAESGAGGAVSQDCDQSGGVAGAQPDQYLSGEGNTNYSEEEEDSESECGSHSTTSTAPLQSPQPEIIEGEVGEQEGESSRSSSSCSSNQSSSSDEEEEEAQTTQVPGKSLLKDQLSNVEDHLSSVAGPSAALKSETDDTTVTDDQEKEGGKFGDKGSNGGRIDSPSSTENITKTVEGGRTETSIVLLEKESSKKRAEKGVTSRGQIKEEGDKEKDDKKEQEDTIDEMSARAVIRTGSVGLTAGAYGEPDRQTQTIQEMLGKLGCGLQENELWSLCRECVQALSRYRYDLPAYISLETVFIEEGGEIGYQSVPDDRELEVVYLAPELQHHGVVTEKTCLFGIAAMLWSAADYKLPQNQEPALSEQLENLLMSMTQDNHELRPQVTDVLQVCSEYDRRQEVGSRLICQGLYSDAQKAEHFGKDNALIRDIITDDVKKQQASRHHQIVNCIKITAELQSQLKPVGERQLAEKPVVRTLHDKLMDEILNPTKKLRKSSRPKVVPVREIFINNPDLMADLHHVTSGQHQQIMGSAFIPRQPMRSLHAQQRALQHHVPGASHHVPNAFQSQATHFSPIIVSANGQQQQQQQMLGKPQIRNSEVYTSSDTDKKVAKKMRELKKNLLKGRPPLSIASDVEKDALQQDSNNVDLYGHGHMPNHFNPQLQHGQHVPNIGNLSPGTLSQIQPQLLSQQQIMNGQLPPGVQLAPGQQIPGGQQQMQPGSGGQQGLFPFQVQLQHDPRTGLFQLIPISVQAGQQSQQQPQPGMVQQPQQQNQAVYGTTHSPSNIHQNSMTAGAGAQSSVSEAQEMANQIQRESEERRRYLKHTEEELKARVKSDARSSRSSGEKRTEHKVKSRSRDKDGHKIRSHTVSSSDFKDGLARATNNVRTRAKDPHRQSHSESNLKRSNSEENIVDKVDKPSSRHRSHRSNDARTRLKRAKSGSSLDYRAMDTQMKDIHLEEQNNNHRHSRTSNRESASGVQLSKSHQHLELDLPQDDVRRSRDVGQGRRTRSSAHGHSDDPQLRSPLGDTAVSPPPSPSLSKDSGVSGLNMKSSGELTLMERLLNSDTIRHQQRLSKVISLLREEFAFDGYMENGVEDFAMAEYILSLGNLKWETFNNAVTEKYCDLFWQDELLTGLYEAVNGTRPVIEKRVSSNPKLSSPRSSSNNDASKSASSALHQSQSPHQSNAHHRPSATRPPRAGSPKPPIKSSPKKSAAIPMGQAAAHLHQQQHLQHQQHLQQQQQQQHHQNQHQQANHMNWNAKARATHDTITGSAFRPIRAIHPPEGSGAAPGAQNPAEGPVFKPKPMKAPGSHTDTSDSTDNDQVNHRPRRFRKKQSQLDKGKSTSMHELLLEKPEHQFDEHNNNNQMLTKSHSQGNLMDNLHDEPSMTDPHRLGAASDPNAAQQQQQPGPGGKMGIAVSMDGNKPKVVYIRSSESENDSYESNTNAAYHHHQNQHLGAHMQEDVYGQRARHMRAMANSTAGYRTSNSFAYRYDSDSSSTSADRRNNSGDQYNSNSLPFQRHNANRIPQRSHSREDSQSESSRSSGGPTIGRRLISAKSEGHLNTMGSSGDEFGSRDRVYSGSRRMFRGNVVYYPAEMEHYLRPEIREFAVQVWNRRKALAQDTRTKEAIEAKMGTLDQEMMMEHRQKRKTLRFFQKLVEANRSGKSGDQKNMLQKVAKQLIEMNTKLEFLDSAKKHLEMLYAEQWGLDHYLLYSLAECPPDEPMLLSACENPHLQYQTVKATAGGQDTQVLQAGQPEGLMAYLFAQNSLSEGYIHQFFYCFRYFVTPAEFLDFLMVKFIAATLSLSPDADVPMKVKSRSVDLLQVWIEGYYSIDFKHNQELTNMLYDFLKEKVVPVEPTAEYLLELLEDAQDDRHIDLHYPQFCVADDFELQLIQSEAPPKKDDKKQLKEWESFKAALHFSAKPQKLRHQMVKARVASLNADRYLSQFEIDKCDNDAYFPRASMGRLGDTFMLSDYTSVTLAEQLTCMEQDLFRQSHPVHFLNSKAQGVGVALTAPAINKAQSMYRLTAAWEDNQESSLFVGTFTTDDIIQRMIEHSQAIAFWVAAEIVCCDSSKTQIAAISKFLTTARLCQEMRNFASCISILDGLENVLVRQVPAWRNLPSKYATIMDELSSIRGFLKSDPMCLLEAEDARSLPTIPCVLLFLLHVQQLEIGGFRLANTMYKWPKIKSIGKVIDQIRIFKEHSYNQTPDYELQDMIRQRMRDLGQQDLHVLAAQHDTNFQKVPSRNIFKRMKGKMGKSSEG